VHKQFRRFDIVVGSLFAVLVIIGVVTVSTSSKPTANSSRIAKAKAVATATTSGATPPSAPAPARATTSAPIRTAPPPTPAEPAPARAEPAPPPRTTPATHAAPPPARPAPPPTQAAPAAPAGCTPKTDGGNCYEPGEFCRTDDHGDNGVAGDGKAIRCEDNDGWRWEPV
jgi:hypothetical protein